MSPEEYNLIAAVLAADDAKKLIDAKPSYDEQLSRAHGRALFLQDDAIRAYRKSLEPRYSVVYENEGGGGWFIHDSNGGLFVGRELPRDTAERIAKLLNRP